MSPASASDPAHDAPLARTPPTPRIEAGGEARDAARVETRVAPGSRVDAVADVRRVERVRLRQDAMLAAIDVGLWYCDLPFDELVWDRKVKEHFWLPPDARVTIDTFYARIHPDDRARTRAAIERSIAEHGPYDVEYRTVAPDGHPDAGAVRWVRAIGYTAYDGAGHPVRFDGVTVDVSATKRAEAAERAARAEAEAERAAADLERRRLAAVLEQLPVGVYVAEAPSGRLVLHNAAVRRIWGEDAASATIADYSRDYVGYHPAGTPRAGERYESHEWPLARALTRGEVVADERIEVPRPNGARATLSVSAIPVRDAAGAIVGGVVTSMDVTERERLLAESEAARRAAEAASQAKGLFLANMSHELRTPLNAIGGYAQLLEMGLHGPVTEEQRGALGRVQRAQTRLLALINDVLNYAKLESGRVEYDVRAVDLRDVVADVVPLIEPQMRAKGLAFTVRLPEERREVWADREKLGQVLVNLLANAVKFTESPHPITGAPGQVTVDLGTRRPTAGGDAAPGALASGPHGLTLAEVVFLRVTDTGVGVPRDKQERIFEPFVQVRSGYAQATEGTGLGLAISRDLARGMGGDLRVRSEEGRGSTFTLKLRRVVTAEGASTDRRLSDERREDERRRDRERRHGAIGAGGGGA